MQNLDFSIPIMEFTSEHVREMEKFNQYKQDKCEAHFDDVARYYEDIYLRAGFPDPSKCA